MNNYQFKRKRMEVIAEERDAEDERRLDDGYITDIKTHAYQSPTKYKPRLGKKVRQKVVVYRKQELVLDLTSESAVELVDDRPRRKRPPITDTINVEEEGAPRALRNLTEEPIAGPARPVAAAPRSETEKLIDEHRRMLESFAFARSQQIVEPQLRICRKTASAESARGNAMTLSPCPNPPNGLFAQLSPLQGAPTQSAKADSVCKANMQPPSETELPSDVTDHFNAISICFQRPLAEVRRLYEELGCDLNRLKQHFAAAWPRP